MNRYPLWKYLLIAFTIVLAIVYTLPNLYGVTPAIQISTNRQSITIDSNTEKTVADALQKANIQHGGMFIAGGSLKVRVSDATKSPLAMPLMPRWAKATSWRKTKSPTAPNGWKKWARNPCFWAWTCVAACISPCKWT